MPNTPLTADAVLNELRKDRKHWTAWRITHRYSPTLARMAQERVDALTAAIVCVEAVRDVDPTVFDRVSAALGAQQAAA